MCRADITACVNSRWATADLDTTLEIRVLQFEVDGLVELDQKNRFIEIPFHVCYLLK